MNELDECSCNECNPIKIIFPRLGEVVFEFMKRQQEGLSVSVSDVYYWLKERSKADTPSEYEIKTCVNKVIDKWQNDNGIILTDDLSLKITKEILSLYNVSHETIR